MESTFTAPLRIVPIAGVCATGVWIVTTDELKRQIKAIPDVSALYQAWAPITQHMIPSYIRLSIDFFDPTADGLVDTSAMQQAVGPSCNC